MSTRSALDSASPTRIFLFTAGMSAWRRPLPHTRCARTVRAMTTLMVVDGNRGDRRSVAVARRLREELAGQQISVAEVARRLHVTQQKLSRRMTGHTPWDVDELDEVCRAAGVSFDYVTTGIRAVPTPDGGQSGRRSLLLPRKDSNLQPPGSMGNPFWPARELADVA
jgi:transcriptional regulator with XRE-family HTH domain